VGRSIYCSSCKNEKEVGRDNESYCRLCKIRTRSERLKKKRLKEGWKPRERNEKMCRIDNCLKKAIAKELCNRHYLQIQNYGKTFISRIEANDYLEKEGFFRNYKIDIKTGCWVWVRHKDLDGYGTFGLKGKNYKAHRWAYKLYNGIIPKGLSVCHTCDNRCCVNPEHLFVGTTTDNMADKASKNRQAKGSKNGKAILTEEKVLEIKKALKNSTIVEVAAKFKVAKSTISHIRSGRTWGHT
jgi:hypothetical protein